MCRFLVALGAEPFAPGELVDAFTRMAETSRSPEGDRQGDGWGVAWLDESGCWQRHRSLAPIWKDTLPRGLPSVTRGLAVHARSASFPGDRGEIEHNQPFLLGRHAFVFNGRLAGVALPGRRPGEVGAQRIATLLGAFLMRQPAAAAIGRLAEVLEQRSRQIPALDLAIAGDGEIVALSRYEAHEAYYRLHVAEHDGFRAICSQALDALAWRPLETGRPVTLRLAG